MERKDLSKKTRFEVFKRDNFTCQYCGRKAPEVVLNVDHIVPVSKGGTNDLLNLITSCFDCNNGKSNIPLSDDSVVNKQRLQIEQLQERREQIEMMFEWKKSVEHLDSFTSELLVEYIESKISPFSLNEAGKRKISNLLKRFSIDEMFDTIDQGVKTYLKYDTSGMLTKDSVVTFLEKIGGIAAYRKLSPVDRKMHYIKGICRNRFGYWDDKKGLAILRKYINALRAYGWSEERIEKDLETEACEVAKNSKNWSQWRQTMEDWTNQINNWERRAPDPPESCNSELELNEIKEISKAVVYDISSLLDFICFLRTPFKAGQFDRKVVVDAIHNYINAQVDAIINSSDVKSLEPNYQLCKKLHLFDSFNKIDSELTRMIDDMVSDYIPTCALDWFYLPSHEIYKAKDARLFKEYFDKEIATLYS